MSKNTIKISGTSIDVGRLSSMSAVALYSGDSSKLFLSGSLPTARLDTGHTSHNKKPHLHLGNGKALKLSSKDAVDTYALMSQRAMLAEMNVPSVVNIYKI